MEHEQDSNLTLPLFLFDDTLNTRDIEQPDLLINVSLDETLLTQLCQNPNADSSIAINLADYQLDMLNKQFSELLEQPHQAQLTLTQGPLLSALLTTEDERSFVSPQVDMMPTFDLGDEVE
ncbi:MAG: hypothetical protein ACTJH9_00715 [Pseudoalteromonas sp.]|uniref:hypothetical protein n=1 Tax=unclassified Pseudoalteromonas TaxID=194690 RepID=UPI003F9DABB0